MQVISALLVIGVGCGVEKIVGGEAEALDGGVEMRPVLGEKLLAFGVEQEVAGSGGDEHAKAAAGFDDSLVDQLLIALEDGERVDAVFGGHGADGGKRLTLFEQAVEDHGDDAAAKLAVDRLGVVPLVVHGALLGITVVVDYNSEGMSRGVWGGVPGAKARIFAGFECPG
jgi:hypothetical protein